MHQENVMESTAPIDSREYFLIPQAYEGGGYYVQIAITA